MPSTRKPDRKRSRTLTGAVRASEMPDDTPCTSNALDPTPYSMYVFGDAGRDIFTFNEDARDDSSPKSASAPRQLVYDINVPSGAVFMQTFFSRLFDHWKAIDTAGTTLVKQNVHAQTGLHDGARRAHNSHRFILDSIGPTLAHVKPFVPPKNKAHRIWTHERLEQTTRPPPKVALTFSGLPNKRQKSATSKRGADIGDRLLLIYDAHHKWQDATGALLEKQIDLLDRFATGDLEADLKLPTILIDLNNNLPELKTEGEDGGRPRFKDRFWQHLSHKGVRGDVGILVSVSTIRRAGGAISRRLSLEHVVEDLTADLHMFPPLRALSRFGHLFVRLGMVAVIHIRNVEGRLSGDVHFTPYGKDGIHRDGEVDGHVTGRNTMLMAALACQIQRLGEKLRRPQEELYRNKKALLTDISNDFPGAFRKGFGAAAAHAYRLAISNGLTAIIKADDAGYAKEPFEPPASKSGPDEAGNTLIRKLADSVNAIIKSDKLLPPDYDDDDAIGPISTKPIPLYLLEGPLPGERRTLKRWRILDDVLEDAPIHRINVAMAIVMAGYKRVFNRIWKAPGHDTKSRRTKEIDRTLWKLLTRVEWWSPRDRAQDFVTLADGDRPAMPDMSHRTTPPIIGDVSQFELNVPIMKFNQLIVAERDEIEGIRSISNILKIYLREKTYGQPISIAVFGPPGSGKSFAVKEIANVIDPKHELLTTIEYNVAQFRGPEDLAGALTKVGGEAHQKIPLVFFDEFDCACNDKPLGWLKYFLAPMQDGKFYAKETIGIGRAIFVFAGGIHSTFEKFDPRIAVPDEELGLTITEEHKARVRLFREQKGPDFISRLRGHINVLPINAESGRTKHFIRRSIQLRSILERRQHLTRHKVAAVDESVIYALLTVDRYRHGVRSMEAVIQMCTRIQDRIEIASLPSRAQLNMHVDADEFLVRVHRGRQRRNWEWHSNESDTQEPRSVAQLAAEIGWGTKDPDWYVAELKRLLKKAQQKTKDERKRRHVS